MRKFQTNFWHVFLLHTIIIMIMIIICYYYHLNIFEYGNPSEHLGSVF